MNELFQEIAGYPLYLISSEGYVLNSVNNKRLNSYLNNRGYPAVMLYRHGHQSTRTIHKLLADAFIKNEFNGTKVAHINKKKLDNSLDNLRWISQTELNLARRLADPRVKPINQYDLKGNIIKVWASGMEAKRAGYSQTSISGCCKGRLKTHKKCRWSFV